MDPMDKFNHWVKSKLRIRPYPNLPDLENKWIIGDINIIINVSDIVIPEVYNKIREKGLEYF